jgi:hypothetical protein
MKYDIKIYMLIIIGVKQGENFVMLYAVDTILLAESAEDLQVQLNAFGEYCDNWKMKVNVNKTKIMVFGFGKLRQNLKFTYKNVDISTSFLPNPQTSLPYKRIGFIILSKRSSWIFTDNLYNLPN